MFDPFTDELLDTLSERERKILIMRYRKHKSLKEIGDIYGITGERIRQIEAKAFRKMAKLTQKENTHER